MNLILTEFKASGKSNLGKLLAERFHWNFVDLVSFVERLYFRKKGIKLGFSEIYKKEGEEGFKCLEREGLEEILKNRKQVISLGSEAPFVGEEILDTLKKNTIVNISVKPDILYQRIMKNGMTEFINHKNPEGSFRELYHERSLFYEKIANFNFDSSERDIKEVVDEICTSLKGKRIIENWYAVRTKSRHEQKVKDRLLNKSFKTFLPLMETWSKRKDRKKKILRPLFTGYLFIDFELTKDRWLEILKTQGVANLLGYTNEPYPVPDEQILSIKTVVDSGLTANPHPYLKKGDKVIVISGPLEGAVGILLDIHEKKQRLVISVDMLNKAVVVDIEGDAVAKY